VDEGVDIADRAVAATAERCGGLEARVRDAELAQRTGTERAQAAMGERLAEGLDKVPLACVWWWTWCLRGGCSLRLV